MKPATQIDAMRAVRKPMPPRTRIFRDQRRKPRNDWKRTLCHE